MRRGSRGIRGYGDTGIRGDATYAADSTSKSESSVSRLLGTLTCSPSESSLGLRDAAPASAMSAAGPAARSSCAPSSTARFLRLNRPERRRWWCVDELSLRPSWPSLGPSLPTDSAEVLALLERVLSARPSDAVMLRLRPTVAMAGLGPVWRGCGAGESLRPACEVVARVVVV